MGWSILSIRIKYEQDIVAARQRARQLATLLGFDVQDQTRLATAVSEIARNAFNYAGGGKVEFRLEGQSAPQLLVVQVKDQGPGIVNVDSILDGQYRSETGLGLGIVGTQRLVDQFELESSPGHGTTVRLKKLLPKNAAAITTTHLQQIAAQLSQQQPQSPFEEIQHQNYELLRTLEELRQRQEDLIHLNHELEDTNRGVVALYAELDEQADHLRRADEMKSHFLSNMSHEFRTPLNSILALSQLLLDRTDGELTSEQEKQVNFIRKSADTLLELVNDLLDLAKIEAGKIVIQPTEFEVAELFSGLRGMLKPLLLNESVNLVFEEPQGIPLLYTDESKVSQILRNFISNALKFTERGEVRISASLTPSGDKVAFVVADTGIGIAPDNQAHIFEEFTQLDNPLQQWVKGTGLGLPLCRKLATLLNGEVMVESQLGLGSTFSAVIPLYYSKRSVEPEENLESLPLDPERIPVLVLEDEAETHFSYEEIFNGSDFQPILTHSISEMQQRLRQFQPRAIILDILSPGEDTWAWLAELKGNETTKQIPILLITSVEDGRKGLAFGADAYGVKPVEREWLLQQLVEVTQKRLTSNVLVIDNEETARYLLKKMLAETSYHIIEVADGLEGIRRARQEQPQVIFLDLMMPGMTGFEVLEQLKTDPVTQAIPVIVISSKILTEKERQQLAARSEAFLSKESLSPEIVVDTVKKVMDVE